MVEEFDKYPLTARYVSELGRFWDALNKCQTNAKKISEIAKEHHGTITSLNIKVNALLESKRTEEKSSEKLTQVNCHNKLLRAEKRAMFPCVA